MQREAWVPLQSASSTSYPADSALLAPFNSSFCRWRSEAKSSRMRSCAQVTVDLAEVKELILVPVEYTGREANRLLAFRKRNRKLHALTFGVHGL